MYIGPKSRTERRRKTKIGTEVDHVTRDSDITFKVLRSKGQRSTCRGRGILWQPPAQLVIIIIINSIPLCTTTYRTKCGDYVTPDGSKVSKQISK